MTSLTREDVQTYPRPPVVMPVPQTLVVRLAGMVVAQTTAAVRVLETHHAPTYYLPPQDVLAGCLIPAPGQTSCEWKGRARYYDVSAGGTMARRAAWAYDTPTPGFAALSGFIAFYAGKMEACFVGDERVIPQPGDFYGGWVTANLDGIPKGARGTEHW